MIFNLSFLRNDSLFYISSQSGTDNIYLLTPDKRYQMYHQIQIWSKRSVHNGRQYVIFSDYSSEGNNMCWSIISSENAEIHSEHTVNLSFLINRIISGQATEESFYGEYI